MEKGSEGNHGSKEEEMDMEEQREVRQKEIRGNEGQNLHIYTYIRQKKREVKERLGKKGEGMGKGQKKARKVMMVGKQKRGKAEDDE